MTIVVTITAIIAIIAKLAILDDMKGMKDVGDMNGIRIMDDEPDKLGYSLIRAYFQDSFSGLLGDTLKEYIRAELAFTQAFSPIILTFGNTGAGRSEMYVIFSSIYVPIRQSS